MTPSKRAEKLQSALEDIALLIESAARTQRLAISGGVALVNVGIGPDQLEPLAVGIRHFVADLGPLVTETPAGDDDRCAECGEILTGA